ncbi:uncharacterized protein [Drosophila tropicalis]
MKYKTNQGLILQIQFRTFLNEIPKY